MEQIGTVEQIIGEKAVVAVNRASACGEGCAHCKGGCAPGRVRAYVINIAEAEVGDVVKIETDTADVVRASLILYFVPCVLAIFAAAAATELFCSAAAAACACAVFFAAFAVIKCFDKRIAPVSKITKIMKKAGTGVEE